MNVGQMIVGLMIVGQMTQTPDPQPLRRFKGLMRIFFSFKKHLSLYTNWSIEFAKFSI
jgi:hypothetical protein